MIDASKEALSFVADITEKSFSQNRMLILSVVKDIEIIGEAASRISEETQLKYPVFRGRYYRNVEQINPWLLRC